VILSAFCDESGTHPNSKVVAVGGFLAEADKWDDFAKEWAPLVATWDLPYFHMTSFANQTGAYATWTEHTRRQRLNLLLDVIDKYLPVRFGVAFPRAAFNRVVPEHVQQHCGGPYGLAAQLCFHVVNELWGESLRALEASVAYFFEKGAEGAGQIIRAFNRNQKIPSLLLESLDFVAKIPEVQPADMLAYEMQKHLPVELGWRSGEMRYPLRRLLASDPRGCRIYNDGHLREVAEWIDGQL
jgi:hypothetical protein